jgi:geranylgeranyl diphosphate synthase type II
MGAMVAGADDSQLAKLEAYALAIGLAFQVQDDILDETGDTQTLGKTQGTDRRLQKATYPHLLGLPAAQELALQLRDQAISAIEHFGHGAAALRELAHYIISRRH